MPLACPTCGSRNLRPALYKDAGERINALRFIAPPRCKDCRTRFVSRTVFPGELLYARCPECRRMDLNGWMGKTYQPRGSTAVKVALGAYKWRCEYCRINFASFRKRREAFTFGRWKKRNPDLVAEKPAALSQNSGDAAANHWPAKKRPGFTVRFSDPSACRRSLCSKMLRINGSSLAVAAFQHCPGS